MKADYFILAIGVTAQLFFSARILVQWILSERAKRVLSPSLFWVLSLAGSFLLCLYGWLRHDFSIVAGQVVSYYIYLWNLKEKGIWTKWPVGLRGLFLGMPGIAFVGVLNDLPAFSRTFFHNAEIPLGLLLFGCGGQLLFTLRFVYQWMYSRDRHESVLPPGFWRMSVAGSSLILLYGLIRPDVVLVVGQSFGLAAYIRNLMLGTHSLKSVRHER